MKNSDKSAFGEIEKVSDDLIINHGGLTKREYAAIQIAAGILSDAQNVPGLPRKPPGQWVAEQAVYVTDALMAELDKNKP